MCTDPKSNLINSYRVLLADKVDSEVVSTCINALMIAMEKYQIVETTTELALNENESLAMLQMFIATKKIEGRSTRTLYFYNLRLIELLSTVGKPFGEMTVNDLRMYLAKKQFDGCSERTASSYRSIMVSFFGWATAEELIDRNPTLNLGVIKYRREIKKPFSSVEIEKMRNSCESVRDRALVEFLLASGCRISEVCNAKVKDVDFDKLEVKVLGKGNKERKVYIDDVTVMWLKKYLDTRKHQNEHLFHARGGKPLSDNGARYILDEVAKRCGVTNVHPHRFRRTLATHLIKRGMDIQDVAAILGHSNINTTMTYVYMSDESVKTSYQKYA